MNSRYREHIAVDSLAKDEARAHKSHSAQAKPQSSGLFASLRSVVAIVVFAFVALQFYFIVRIGLMNWVNPESTSFQRSEAVRIIRSEGKLYWRQKWVAYDFIADSAKRAVIASEDGEFTEHSGIDWDAVEAAAQRNARAEATAERRLAAIEKQEEKKRARAAKAGKPAPAPSTKPLPSAKIVGGSTITQQLAKNLFLSGERSLLRKAQEVLVTFTLEAFLPKRRILEIYLNSVEWGEGVFGIEAAAQHYFKKPASKLSNYEAARLAVMLPNPRFYGKKPNSAYLTQRASRIASQMKRVELP